MSLKITFFIRILETNLFNKIQFNSLYINMWLSSLNIFEENQFYKIKKEKHLTHLICD